MYLQTFVQEMLPKDASHVFGQGLAGSFWSSMLAEQIAGQMSKSGGLGIADLMASRAGASARPAALPGYLSSLEFRFADSVLPTGDKNDTGLLAADES